MLKDQENFIFEHKNIFVAGNKGMVGRAIINELNNYECNIQTINKSKLDLRDEFAVNQWFKKNKPHVVIIAAAKVGGIYANSLFPVDFLEDNIRIQNNLISNSHKYSVQKLIFLGSSCIYPKDCPQPISEDYLLSGKLEKTNEWYALAKIAGIKLCQAYRKQFGDDFISLMPTNLYGPYDNYHPEYSHVPAALIRKFHEAKTEKKPLVKVWGTGKPRREFLHVNDLAKAVIHMLKFYSSPHPINIGSGKDVSIEEFANIISRVVGYKGEFTFDLTKPDGTMLKCLDVSKAKELGWEPYIDLKEGLESSYKWALQNIFN